MTFFPLQPLWVILPSLALTVGVTLYALRRRPPVVEPWQHGLLLTLRIASLLLVVLMLFCPGHMKEERNLDRSHLVFLIDTSASMSSRDLPNLQSRLECANDFIRGLNLKRLTGYPTPFYTFSDRTTRLADRASLGKQSPSGGTDLQQAVAQIDKDIGLNRTAAIVLVSDGIDLSSFKGNELAVPILSVQTGTDLAKARDLAIEPFPCPSRINTGETLTLKIPLRMQGYSGEKRTTLTVSLDGHPLQSAPLTLTHDRLHTETVQITPAEAGLHVIRIACDTLPDEVSVLNNHREIAIESVEMENKIVAYFPLLNTSFRPLLREFMKTDKDAFTAFYRVADSVFRVSGNPPDNPFAQGLPKSADALNSVTCLILGSHNGDLISPAEALVLEQYVNRGGSLVCLAGADSFGKLPSGSPLTRLLPVITLEASFQPGAFKVVPDPNIHDALTEQVAAIIADNASSPGLVLTGINRVKDLKAAARVELWAEDETRHPLLVWHTYGRGKVTALLSNAFHQWGSADRRDDNFSRFWRQLVAFTKTLDEKSDLLSLSLPKTELATGERVTLTALAHRPGGSDQNLTVKADIFRAESDTPVASMPLVRKAGSFTAELPGLSPGRYVLRVSSQDALEVFRTRYKLLLVDDVLNEGVTLKSTRESFRRFSSAKHIFTPDESGQLEDRLVEAVRKNVIQRERLLIFETPFFLIALVFLLLAEWLLRRRFNLF